MKIYFTKLTWNIEKAITDWINEATDYLIEKVREKSPTDTGAYIKWHKIEKATNYWNRIKGSVYNDMEYAQEVEYWFRRSAVNWHKWPPRNESTRFYTWVGARPYTRTWDEEEKTIINIIKKNINSMVW